MPSSTYNLRHLGDVCGGDHVCFLCNGPHEKWRVLSEFYKTGLQKNEKILFFQHNTPEEEAIQKLEKGGIIDIRECTRSGQFQVLHYTEIYTVQGVFDPETMICKLLSMIEQTLSEGYSALRVCGDMSWVNKEEDLNSKLLQYESQLNNEFPNSFSAICLYDTNVFKPAQMLQILSTHPQVIIKEKLYQNIYYMPPDEYLGPDLNEAMLKRWMQNIEERKTIEEQLIASKMEAEKAALAKASFLATMSHEIRNPTNGIIGSVDMLAQTKTTAEQHEYIKIIQASAKHLYRVVNDVLDFSKVESGKLSLSLSPLRLKDLLEDSLRLCEYSLQRNLAVSLRCHAHPACPDVVVADETRLRQILVNLIGNACKFTEEGEVVVSVAPVIDEYNTNNLQNTNNITNTNNNLQNTAINISPDDNIQNGLNKRREIRRDFDNRNNENNKNNENNENNTNEKNRIFLEFSVSDSGSGISSGDQSKLFQKFTQLDVTRKWAGTGLGLAICKSLVETMGGKIEVRSIIGKGSTFSFKIPVSVPPPSPSILSPPSLSSSASDESTTFSFSPTLSSSSISTSSVASSSSSLSPLTFTSPLLLQPDHPPYSSTSSSIASLSSSIASIVSMASLSSTANSSTSIPIPLSPSNSSSNFATLSSSSASSASTQQHLLDSPSLSSSLSSSSSFSSLSLSSSSSFSAFSLASISSPPLSSISSPSIMTSQDHFTNSPPTALGLNYDFSGDHVLVVEDDITNQKVLKYMLRKLRCKVTVAHNGLEAVKLSDKNHFTMIITDQYMPELDGYSAIKEIREKYKREKRECPPVIVCTGTYEARLDEVMDDILIKPVRFKTILDMLLRHCTNKAD